MVKKRPAITLFITLAVIVAMLSLVAIVFSYLSDARQKAQDKAALIQSNVVYADAVGALKGIVGKKPSTNILKNIYSIPLTIEQIKGSFNMLIACSPSHAAIPIGWFSQKGGAKNQAKLSLASRVFEEITTQARLKDAQLLQELIINAVDSKMAIAFGKEGNLKKRAKFLSYNGFKKVLNEYRLQSDDTKVYSIDWQLYFAFGSEYGAIDGNFMPSKLIASIFDIDEQIVQEDFKSGELKSFLQNNGGDMGLYKSSLFAKEVDVAMKCSVNYTFGKGSYSFSFKYDNGKVDSFEFNQ